MGLTLLIAPEDCATRCLVKPEEMEEMNAREIQKTDNDEGNAEKAKMNDDMDENSDNDETKKKSGGKSQYEKDKEKNIAWIQEILMDLDAHYLLPEEFTQNKLLKVKAKKGKQGQKEPTIRWESQRMRDKIR